MRPQPGPRAPRSPRGGARRGMEPERGAHTICVDNGCKLASHTHTHRTFPPCIAHLERRSRAPCVPWPLGQQPERYTSGSPPANLLRASWQKCGSRWTRQGSRSRSRVAAVGSSDCTSSFDSGSTYGARGVEVPLGIWPWRCVNRSGGPLESGNGMQEEGSPPIA